jgi:hypothetical protein
VEHVTVHGVGNHRHEVLRNSGPEKWIKRIKQDLRCLRNPDLKKRLKRIKQD